MAMQMYSPAKRWERASVSHFLGYGPDGVQGIAKTRCCLRHIPNRSRMSQNTARSRGSSGRQADAELGLHLLGALSTKVFPRVA